MVNLSQRAGIVKRMDNQFNSNLEMRRTLHALDQRAKLIYANCKLFQKVFTISINFRTPQYRLPVWNVGITIVQDNLILRNSKTTITMFSIWFKMHDQTVLQLKPFWSALTWKKSKARFQSFRTYKSFLLDHCQFLVTLGAVETTEKSMTRPLPELRSFHHGWSKSVMNDLTKCFQLYNCTHHLEFFSATSKIWDRI